MKTNDLILIAAVGLAVYLVLKKLLPEYDTLSGLNVIKGSQQDRMLDAQW